MINLNRGKNKIKYEAGMQIGVIGQTTVYYIKKKTSADLPEKNEFILDITFVVCCLL